MRIIDSNIIIYSALDEFSYLREYLKDSQSYVSKFSEVEVLGYYGLKPNQKQYFESVFYSLNVLPITDPIVQKVIDLRQQKKMTAGDSIIAATALISGFEVITRNTSDFDWIENLKVHNPIK
ncbi:MAG TPA: type II toxin-antitoxin system VapC family toxin [Leadbetterella sp.]|nr:type II toxin-antitoxin system VapC family toxin [Leadbetterella sp.]